MNNLCHQGRKRFRCWYPFSLFDVLTLGLITILCGYHGTAHTQTNLRIPSIREVMDDPFKEAPTASMESSMGLAASSVALIDNASDPAMSFYINAVEEKISKIYAQWPRDSSGRPITGSVVVILTIASNGSLLNVSARGDGALASAVIDKVTQASPFPSPSTSLLKGRQSLQFNLTVAYRQETGRQMPPRTQPMLPYMSGPMVRMR